MSTAALVSSFFSLTDHRCDDHDEKQHENENNDQILVRFQDRTHVVRFQEILSSAATTSTGCTGTGIPSIHSANQVFNCTNSTFQPSSSSSSFCWLLLSFWSHYTKWPMPYLQIVSLEFPFVSIRIRSCIRGGKGGFGTLLKGQSRQAGAKLTTDFGACRDLQGRRLRHVNDEIKLRKWRELQERKKQQQHGAGNNNKEDDDFLWNTPSGIYNWHLMTPTWADISRKATYRIKRQFRQMDAQAKKEALKRKEQEEAYQKSMTYYLEQTNQAVESIQESLEDAIQQGLLAAKAAAATKKRKRTDTTTTSTVETKAAATTSVAAATKEEELSSPTSHMPPVEDDDDESLLQSKPNSLCMLTGDMIVVTSTSSSSTSFNGKIRLQSQSEFSTAVLVLDRCLKPPPSNVLDYYYYYEVRVVTAGLSQIGWATLVGDTTSATTATATKDDENDNTTKKEDVIEFTPNNDQGDGVGDDGASFAVDGSRGLKFHAGQESSYPLQWKEGDVIGCLWNVSQGTLSYTLNGNDCGPAFTTTIPTLVPAFSCNQGETIELHLHKEDCSYFPSEEKNVISVGELVEKVREEEDSAANNLKPAPTLKAVQEQLPTIENSTLKYNNNNGTKQSHTDNKNKEDAQTNQPEPLDLDKFQSPKELQALGLDRLKSALMAIQVKCGGTLEERASRLFSLKGIARHDYPLKVRAKGFVP